MRSQPLRILRKRSRALHLARELLPRLFRSRKWPPADRFAGRDPTLRRTL